MCNQVIQRCFVDLLQTWHSILAVDKAKTNMWSLMERKLIFDKIMTIWTVPLWAIFKHFGCVVLVIKFFHNYSGCILDFLYKFWTKWRRACGVLLQMNLIFTLLQNHDPLVRNSSAILNIQNTFLCGHAQFDFNKQWRQHTSMYFFLLITNYLGGEPAVINFLFFSFSSLTDIVQLIVQ